MSMNIAYVVADLKRVGPTNQTLNIINNSKYKDTSIVITLFNEPQDSMMEEFKNNNIEIICLNLNRIAFILNGTRKLQEVLKRKKIDIVHSYGVKPDCLCNKICKKTKITHIITLRNYPKEDILTRMNCIKGHIALQNHIKALLSCKYVICCSKTIYEKMKKDYPNGNFSYIQNGVDIKKYNKVPNSKKIELRKKYGFETAKRIYISTGSFIPRKRIDETIKGYIASKQTDSILLLLGDGPLLNDLKSSNKRDDIVFYGKTPFVNEMLQLSDCFVSSSESEGLPNGVIEAISCGLPVILSDIPQHIEILNELPMSGKTYELGNIAQLSKCYVANINNESNINNSSFTMKNMSDKYIKYYERISEVGNYETKKG